MPTFLGIQYEPIPDLDAGSCPVMKGMDNADSVIRVAVESASNYTALLNAVTDNLSFFGIEGRDMEPPYTMGEIQSAVGEYEIYIQSWNAYWADIGTMMYFVLNNEDIPKTWFGSNFTSNLFFNDPAPDGSCGMWRNQVEQEMKPYWELYMGQLSQAQNQFSWVVDAIEQRQQDILSAIQLNIIMQEAYQENLEIVAENEASERAIQQSRFLHNVSQFSIVGAAVVLGADQLKLLK
mgnify:CR=1 FL=1